MNAPRIAAMPSGRIDAIPPHSFLVVSAVFHYLGPSFAVLLFAYVEPLGVAWIRIGSAALVFALWRRPWRRIAGASRQTLLLIVALALTLAAMNACFYIAIDTLPLATVAAIEFVAPIALALAGVRSARNLGAVIVSVAGVYALIGLAGTDDSFGLLFAGLNAILFAFYMLIGHALSRRDDAGTAVDRLGAVMIFAIVLSAPIGFKDASVAIFSPTLLLAGIGVGITSSVIPYVCDQLAMARLPRATFALMLTLLPATACIVGAVVLRQIPSPVEVLGVALVVIGIAIHKPAA
jgi:inner membrane transporter RhtA